MMYFFLNVVCFFCHWFWGYGFLLYLFLSLPCILQNWCSSLPLYTHFLRVMLFLKFQSHLLQVPENTLPYLNVHRIIEEMNDGMHQNDGQCCKSECSTTGSITATDNPHSFFPLSSNLIQLQFCFSPSSFQVYCCSDRNVHILNFISINK